MSKSIIMIAALGAGGGAALTAAAYSLRGDSKTKTSIPASATTPDPTMTASSPSAVLAKTNNSSSSSNPVDPSGLFQYGFPGPVADLATRSALVSSYDRRTRNPHWVAEHMTAESLSRREGDRKGSVFVEDESVPASYRALLKDYFRSGYDRGHQVPAADCKWSQSAMDETFYLTNICPQVGEGFNRDYWAHFEDFCRRLTDRYASVRVVTGPLYLPRRDPADNKWYVKYEVIGSPPSVAVPTHFYKVIFAEGARPGDPVALGAFVLPNAPIDNAKPITDFEVPLEAVERASGLEFASKLPPQRRKRLCADTTCSLIIRDYADRQKAFAKGGNDKRVIAPSPKA
ncbi:endonuclease G, mitochondrial [Geosmithia morbida]|uniref:Endonuclease n=1 Tax=Geosmithia morbida TaxID=1094350 RepID=A0A9P4YSR8_9HYPO|nr:endonuclease G, mitochondrial [Geosmithia morbida]KAF4121147.1 endonuclease G, mitochondrial [Geosmithia morbida]